MGQGVQTCTEDVSFQGAVPLKDQDRAVPVRYIGPTIPKSSVPGLLGLETLIKMGAVLDCRNMEMHFLKPEDTLVLPETAITVQSELSPSGHMMLPFSEYHKVKQRVQFTATEPTTVLATEVTAAPVPSSSSSSSQPSH